MTHRFGTLTFVLALAGAVGCGGGSQSSSSESNGQGSSGQEVAGENEGFDNEGFESGDPQVQHAGNARELLGIHAPPSPWDDMNHEAQEDWMVGQVLPIAAQDFATYDADRYSAVTCATCHGSNAEAVHYEMPTAQLPVLPTPGSPDWERMSQTPVFTFMHEVVTPTMAAQLGEEPYNPATNSGFGCFGCHTMRP
jgi:cytochrome c553